MSNITLTKKHKDWARVFESFKSRLLSKLKNIEAVEHIGSTAITSISAKDVIDVQIGVKSLENIADLDGYLTQLGLCQNKDCQQDHVPMKDHDYFEPGWEKRFYSGEFEETMFHVHVRIYDNPNWNFAINFRDKLNQNPDVAIAYEQFKSRLAESGLDRNTYAYIKDPVFDLIYLLVS